MDTTILEKIISCIAGIATLVSTIYSVFSFRKQKNYERSEKALTEFYVPLLRIIEKHLYTDDYTTQSFLKAKTSMHKLFEDQYIFVPFELQRKFNIFKENTNEKNYKIFCDCFLDYYYNTSKNCGIKILTTTQRAANNWYSSKLKKFWCKIELICASISYLVIGVCIWAVVMSVFIKILNMIITWITLQ